MAASPVTVSRPERTAPCPCGSGRVFGECCEPLLTGRQLAVDAEKLMRARFTAHVAHDFRFLHETYRPTAGKPFAEEEGEPPVKWTRLEVHAHETTADPDKSFVDFSAYGTEDGVEK